MLRLTFTRRKIRGTETTTKKNSVVLIRERTVPAERLPLVGEVSANFDTYLC
jgi:hypothetical protein